MSAGISELSSPYFGASQPLSSLVPGGASAQLDRAAPLIPLENAKRDAEALGEIARSHDCGAVVCSDPIDKNELLAFLGDFFCALGEACTRDDPEGPKTAELLCVWYSGHGARTTGHQLLLPCRARMDDPRTWLPLQDLMTRAYLWDDGLRKSRPGRDPHVLFLVDCCRELLDVPSAQRIRQGPACAVPYKFSVWYSVWNGRLADDGHPGAGSPFFTTLVNTENGLFSGAKLTHVLEHVNEETNQCVNFQQIFTCSPEKVGACRLVQGESPCSSQHGDSPRSSNSDGLKDCWDCSATSKGRTGFKVWTLKAFDENRRLITMIEEDMGSNQIKYEAFKNQLAERGYRLTASQVEELSKKLWLNIGWDNRFITMLFK